jgi:HEAT repeat protein
MHAINRLALRAAFAAALAIAAAGAPLLANGQANEAMAPSDKQLNQLYWQGHEALKKSDWNTALKRFSDLEQQMRTKEPKNADAAIYWEAYALTQAKRGTEAKTTVERLHRDYPDSRWGKDADALVRQAQPTAPNADVGSDEDIAEIAVEGLMNAPPERAIPLLKKVLASQHSEKVKKRALFVLSQIDEQAALDAVVDVSGEDAAIERLRELYASSTSAQEKRTIIQAWLTADRKDLILAEARNEPDAAVRGEAIQALGAMDATAELEQLFKSTTDTSNQSAIVQSLGVAGDVAGLTAIAQSQQSESVRIEAIHALGVAGDEGGSQALLKMYPQANTPAIREAVLQGLLVAGDSDGLLQLYRQAKTKEEKQALLRVITTINGDAAMDVIESELKKDTH